MEFNQQINNFLPIVSERSADGNWKVNRLFRWGMLATAVYIGILVTYAFTVRNAMFEMRPEQFATFLSGVCAPLAFFWLVLGFRQQADDLQNSARALWLQGEQLRISIEQQRALVEVSRDQLAAEKAQRTKEEEDAENAAQPKLVLPSPEYAYGSSGLHELRFQLTSAGPTCSKILVSGNDEALLETAVLGAGDQIQFTKRYYAPADVQPLTLNIAYTDVRGQRRAQKFTMRLVKKGWNGHRTLAEPVKSPDIERDPRQ